MSDYGGDEYDEYGDEWLYVEDEYMQADDLAEHAVASPPPTAYDEDQLEEWDRFDYFNDIEYDYEGYDDANFVPHNQKTGQPKIGQKRKRGVTANHNRVKRQKTITGDGKPVMDMPWLTNSPVVWRAQGDREPKPRPLPENAEPYAILKDWRQMDKVPDWVSQSSRIRKLRASRRDLITPDVQAPEDEGMVDGDENAASISAAAVEAALQSRLAGGTRMNPEELNQLALQMAMTASGEEERAVDEVAGQLGMDPKELQEFAQNLATLGNGEGEEGDDGAGELNLNPEQALQNAQRMAEEEDWEDEDVDDGIEDEAGDEEDEEDEEEAGIDSAALMAALQSRLASAGGPLSGMDPEQVLQFALRMANGEDEGDDIAGELADQMLNQDEEEDDEDPETKLMSWLTQQRDANNTSSATGTASASNSANAAPPSKVKRGADDADESMTDAPPETDIPSASQDNALEVERTCHSLEVSQTSRKRKNDTTESGSASPKKRAIHSYAAPTTASQAKAGPAKPTRSARVKR